MSHRSHMAPMSFMSPMRVRSFMSPRSPMSPLSFSSGEGFGEGAPGFWRGSPSFAAQNWGSAQRPRIDKLFK